MGQFVKAFVASIVQFVLPWLFAAWLFRLSFSLPLPLAGWVLGLAAVVVGFLLAADAKPCLERFYRNKEPEKTPISQAARPDLKLHGDLWLLGLYAILGLTLVMSYVLAASYLRTHPRIGPVSWVQLFRAAADSLGDTPSSAANQVALAAALVASLAGVIAYLTARSFIFPDKGPVLRGRQVASVKEARRELSRLHEPGEPEIAWGGLGLPWSSGPRHFLAAGMTGSGKTNLLLQFMASVLIWIGRKPDQRALVYDPKTELLSFLYGLGLGPKVRVLHPLDIRSSAWDLAADVTSPTTAQQMAAVLIPEEKESKNPYFAMAAQQLLAGVFTVLLKTAPGKWDLRDVSSWSGANFFGRPWSAAPPPHRSTRSSLSRPVSLSSSYLFLLPFGTSMITGTRVANCSRTPAASRTRRPNTNSGSPVPSSQNGTRGPTGSATVASIAERSFARGNAGACEFRAFHA